MPSITMRWRMGPCSGRPIFSIFAYLSYSAVLTSNAAPIGDSRAAGDARRGEGVRCCAGDGAGADDGAASAPEPPASFLSTPSPPSSASVAQNESTSAGGRPSIAMRWRMGPSMGRPFFAMLAYLAMRASRAPSAADLPSGAAFLPSSLLLSSSSSSSPSPPLRSRETVTGERCSTPLAAAPADALGDFAAALRFALRARRCSAGDCLSLCSGSGAMPSGRLCGPRPSRPGSASGAPSSSASLASPPSSLSAVAGDGSVRAVASASSPRSDIPSSPPSSRYPS
mmetsp:Transcript_24954/g.86939  ORF Transcript_24954/g.86939 Transcript_24954/m.86939 type:complete len:283 (-) Transcript_24954:473-1321(-)